VAQSASSSCQHSAGGVCNGLAFGRNGTITHPDALDRLRQTLPRLETALASAAATHNPSLDRPSMRVMKSAK
jgi:hypothetical protein